MTLKGRRLLATADYGDVRPAVRLYDPQRLVAAGLSRPPALAWPQFPADPSIRICPGTRPRASRLAQNVVAGLGWKLDVFDLEKAIDAHCQLPPARCGPGSSTAQRIGRLAAGRMAARVRDLESEAQHLRGQEPPRSGICHAQGHVGIQFGGQLRRPLDNDFHLLPAGSRG